MVDDSSTNTANHPWFDNVPINMWPTFVNVEMIENLPKAYN